MIRYSLLCAQGHQFDSWFQSADAFDGLAARGLLSCAQCGSGAVKKALMAPRVTTAEAAGHPPAPPAPEGAGPGALSQPANKTEEMLRAMRDYLDRHSTYVGGRFAAEARAMHLQETEARLIHGEAAPDEARALLEDGIAIMPLPFVAPDKAN
ncbi:DUF1178 family protein [Rhodobacterales bacterium LSUCC0031]|nr:DUF1178 family protein [Rhodobacterales bacterium LSUCC0031]